MNFDFDEDQTMLRDAVSSYLEKNWTQDRHNTGGATERVTLWSGMAGELGLMGIALPESVGGIGGGRVENMLVMEQLGRALALESYVPTVVVAGGILLRSGADPALASAIATGEMRVALALNEMGLRPYGHAVTTTISPSGAINGSKIMVAGAPMATHFMVSAMEPDAAAYSLFLVDANAEGIERRDFTMVDGQPASEIKFVETASFDRLGKSGQGPALYERGSDEANIALGAEAIGIMGALIEQTVAYISQRKQFGQPLASFQVLQHRMADMAMLYEQAKSMVYMATLQEIDDIAAFQSAVSAMKVQLVESLRLITQESVQMHGGMGITDELMIGHYFKRGMVIMASFGTTDDHQKRFDQLMG